MSGVGFRIVSDEIATGTSDKTLVQVVAASNHALLINAISISFKGTSNTAAPIEVQIVRQTTAGTMSSLTPVKNPDDSAETLQVTAQHTATSEPTSTDVLARELVHPQTGHTFPLKALNEAIKVGGGDRLGVLVNAGADVNAVVTIDGEE